MSDGDTGRHELRITVRGGAPTAEELAALAAVITGIAAQPRPSPPTRGPAWSRAARLEALGQAPLTAASDARLDR